MEKQPRGIKVRTVTVTIECKVPFVEYSTEAMNKSAEVKIKRWLKELLNNESSYIPLYVERAENSSCFYEDSTRRIHYKVK